MNAVEIEQAISELAEQPFDAEEFPYAFLTAFGNKATTIKRLRAGNTNKSDVGGVLQTSNIHLKVCEAGSVGQTLSELRASPATGKGKVKFIIATDGDTFEAEDLNSGETVACDYEGFADHFGFFLPLAGISTVKEIRESAFDIKATGRLNRLYVQLLKDNPDWGTDERRHEMNHFMARLIFCFFAEDTDIFKSSDLFTDTIDQMSESDGSNTHEVIMELFRAMNTDFKDREAEKIPRWANELPYVNGGLFAGNLEVPKFTRIARPYLLHIGRLDWKKINPDIFGSMIQAVADDEERGEIGMHYTSVPNILKVLNPLFLDDLREQLEEAGDNKRKLLNLRNRIARIRVFDPACGSGNFLVIAYKEMRAIEAEINERRGEINSSTVIPLTNFRGIEIRDFSAEVARLALIITEYQCDVLYRGQKEAIQDFLPLRVENWITAGNALQIDWLSVCPPTGEVVQHRGDDLFFEAKEEHQIDFENEGGETYICGNPPYIWEKNQTAEQKSDLLVLLQQYGIKFKGLDYVTGWFYKYLHYSDQSVSSAAFVATNSITQGVQVDPLWSTLINNGITIFFAHRSFKWKNLAKNNAGVSVVIIGLSRNKKAVKKLYYNEQCTVTSNISPYLLPMEDVWVKPSARPLNGLRPMMYGNTPICGGGLILTNEEARYLEAEYPESRKYLRNFLGSEEISNGKIRKCLWINNEEVEDALSFPLIKVRVEKVRESRAKSKRKATRDFVDYPFRFIEIRREESTFIAVQCVSSERREYLVPVFLSKDTIISNRCFGIYSPVFWYLSALSSRLHYMWTETTSGKLKTDLNYSNTLTWNNFPLPTLTEKNKADLTRCAENILLAREMHFPATIADLYDPDKMPANLKEAHKQNDEVLERIYIGRRFKNDTERLEKLFELYTKMTTTVNIGAEA
jgi:hypothetical protein